jgi:hypothetical protein
VRADGHAGLRLPVTHGRAPDGAWWAALELPVALLPAGVRAVAAFAIAEGRHLAHRPLPGAAPDFHQPGCWPAARLAD